jgi:DNA-binding transcriptional MerR regulator
VESEDRFSLNELAERSGTPARTVRFYIARGLLEGPITAGRAAHYTAAHLDRLEKIREFQKQGLMLAEIATRLTGTLREYRRPEAWLHYDIAPDVRVAVRDGASPWRVKLIRQALHELEQKLKQQEGE